MGVPILIQKVRTLAAPASAVGADMQRVFAQALAVKSSKLQGMKKFQKHQLFPCLSLRIRSAIQCASDRMDAESSPA